MANQSEYLFNKNLRTNLAAYKFHFHRIENHGIEPGMPDIFFLLPNGAAGWIECKIERQLTKKIAYEKAQPAWLCDYWRHGGFCCTLLYLESSSEIIYIPGNESAKASADLSTAHTYSISFMDSVQGWNILAEYLRRQASQRFHPFS
jgi:hypothetical protein